MRYWKEHFTNHFLKSLEVDMDKIRKTHTREILVHMEKLPINDEVFFRIESSFLNR